ncbi:MAG: sugar phosphate isomerase/epimerase family protein [Oscillochloridaceae bacterium umkhey_bin13]
MQLGLGLHVRPDRRLGAITDQIAALGYQSIHAHFPTGCDAKLARQLARACTDSGLSILAVSGYANPLRPDDAPMGFSQHQLGDLIELMARLDCRRLISWSGSYAAAPRAGHPDNATPAAWETLYQALDELFPLLDEAEAMLLLAPQRNHVLNNAERTARFCGEFNSPYLRLLYQASNLLGPDLTATRDEQIANDIVTMARWIGQVELEARGDESDLLLPDLDLILHNVRKVDLTVPLSVAAAPLEQAGAARHAVLSHILV